MPVVVVRVVVVVGQRVTEHASRCDTDRRSTGVNRLDRTTVGVVGGHAADPAQRDSRGKGEDKDFANQWVFHGEVKPNSRMPEGANGF